MKTFLLIITLFMVDGTSMTAKQPTIAVESGVWSSEEICLQLATNLTYSLQKNISEYGENWPVKLVAVTCAENEGM